MICASTELFSPKLIYYIAVIIVAALTFYATQKAPKNYEISRKKNAEDKCGYCDQALGENPFALKTYDERYPGIKLCKKCASQHKFVLRAYWIIGFAAMASVLIFSMWMGMQQ